MRFLFFFFFTALFSPHVSSQSGQVALEWGDSKTYGVGNQSMSVPAFQDNMVFEGGQLFYRDILPANGLMDPSSLRVSDLRTRVITRQQLLQLDKNLIPEKFEVIVENALSRKRTNHMLTATPIYKDGTTYRQVLSFSYSYSSANRVLNER